MASPLRGLHCTRRLISKSKTHFWVPLGPHNLISPRLVSLFLVPPPRFVSKLGLLLLLLLLLGALHRSLLKMPKKQFLKEPKKSKHAPQVGHIRTGGKSDIDCDRLLQRPMNTWPVSWWPAIAKNMSNTRCSRCRLRGGRREMERRRCCKSLSTSHVVTWSHSDVLHQSTRFFVRAIDCYDEALKKFPTSFDLAYNKYASSSPQEHP